MGHTPFTSLVLDLAGSQEEQVCSTLLNLAYVILLSTYIPPEFTP